MRSKRVLDHLRTSTQSSLPKEAIPSDNLVKQVVQLVPALIAVYNIKTGEYLFASDSVKKILGYTKEEFMGGGISFVSSLVHPEDSPKIYNQNVLALKQANTKKTIKNNFNPIVSFEYRMKHKKGHWIWLKSDGVVFSRDKNNKVECVMNVSVEITKRKESEIKESTERLIAEENLKQSEEKFRTLIEQSTDVVQLLSADGKILYTSESVKKILGYRPKEILGKDGLPYLHPNDAPRFFQEYSKLLEKPGNQITLEYRLKHKNSNWVWIEATGVNHLNNPAVRAIVGNFRDITQRKLLEKQKDEFLGIASHELKTPVTSLKAFNQILERRFRQLGDEKSALLLGKMDAQINKLTSLIQDLLDVSKVESGNLKLHKDYFNFDELIDEVVEEIQRTTDTHKIIVAGKAKKNVYADRERIGQVMTNFLTNAVKYSPSNSPITVRSTAKNRVIQCSVKDCGFGIPKKDLPKVFERFFRVSAKSHDTVPGMGLGLNIAAEIVNRHSGKIWVKSIYGKSSTFYFTLPIK
jgi:PAS domain S-box-containing protein